MAIVRIRVAKYYNVMGRRLRNTDSIPLHSGRRPVI